MKLLRLPRAAIPDNFFSQRSERGHEVNHRLFRLQLRKISLGLTRQINDGPSWLLGDYPAGLLKARHERRRPINDPARQKPVWRDDENIGQERLIKPVTEHTSEKLPLLIHQSDERRGVEQFGRWLPVLVLTGKKRVDKRAVHRNRAKTRLLAGLVNVLSRHADSLPLHDGQGHVLAYVFSPSDAPSTTPLPLIEKAMDEMLNKLKQQVRSARAPKEKNVDRTGRRRLGKEFAL